MNWIESRLREARENKISSLVLDSDLADKGPLPSGVFELRHLTSLKLQWMQLSSELEGLGNLTELEELEIAWCSDVTLPQSLRRLTKLRKLTLSGLRLSRVPSSIGSLRALESLTILGNELDDLPSFLTSLKNLRELNIGLNSFTYVPPILRRLDGLKKLHFGGQPGKQISGASVIQSIEHLPLKELYLTEVALSIAHLDRLSKMSQLETVSLWKCLERFPVPLARLPKLQALYVNDVDVPDEIVEFRALRRLVCSSRADSEDPTRLKASEGLAELRDLETLTLEAMDLRNVFEAFFDFKNLRQFGLSRCGLFQIPSAISRLANLQDFTWRDNPPARLPDGLFTLKNLETLWLPGTLIDVLSEEIARLPLLRRINVSGCGLKSLPAAIGALANLSLLRASRNEITELPSGLTALKKLEVLDLENNELREVPKEVAFLPRLRSLDLTGNPLSTPPPEILSQGLVGIQNYFSALLEAPLERLYEAKILIVGEGGVGKTRLAERLISPVSDSANMIDTRSTEGIEIRKWTVTTPETDTFLINLWDFGGQEIYHATHQFFLTKRSLYLFVWDARKEDRTGGFDYWLNVIRLLSGGSPIIVVLNKVDERVREIDEADLKRHFSNIQEFHKVSALTGLGVDALRNRVKVVATSLPHVGDEWPATWSRARKALENDLRNHISRDQYEEICKTAGVLGSQMNSLSAYLHDLGVILHFQDDAVLQRIVILRPEWGTNAVYKVLDTQRVQSAKGRFTLADLRKIWGNTEYPRSYHPELLQLMIKFELCFPIGESGIYVAPELLSAEMPELEWETQDNLVFEYHYAFMPAGIITRFIARMHSAIDGDKYWRNGVVLARRQTRARVVAEPLNRKIRVAVQGDARRELLSIIRHQIDEIHRTLNEPRVNEMVPCNCAVCHSGVPHLFPYRTLEAYIAKRIPEIRCDKSLENVSIRELLADVFVSEASKENAAYIGASLNIGHIDHIHIEEHTMKPDKSTEVRASNPWISGSFYLLLLVVVFAVLLAASRILSPWWLPLLILGGLLLISVVGALQLRNDDRLTDASFVKLIQLAFKQIPFLGKLASRT
ncbi:MAG: hypothetical protein QOH88_1834 [Verrucomicrobiota bacterium]|jgi:small GTP-binding protein